MIRVHHLKVTLYFNFNKKKSITDKYVRRCCTRVYMVNKFYFFIFRLKHVFVPKKKKKGVLNLIT